MNKPNYFHDKKFVKIKSIKVSLLLKIIEFCSFLIKKCKFTLKKTQEKCSHEFYLLNQSEDHHGRLDRVYTCHKCSRQSNGYE